jgi:hypothetical protein
MATKMSTAANGRALSWLVPTAAVVVLVSLVASGPIAFGMKMARDDAADAHNPLLFVLVVLLVIAITSLAACLIIRATSHGRHTRLCIALAATALASGGPIAALFAWALIG